VHDIVGSMLDFFGLIDDGEVVVPRLRSLRILKVATNPLMLRAHACACAAVCVCVCVCVCAVVRVRCLTPLWWHGSL